MNKYKELKAPTLQRYNIQEDCPWNVTQLDRLHFDGWEMKMKHT